MAKQKNSSQVRRGTTAKAAPVNTANVSAIPPIVGALRISTPDPNDHFRFLDLPAELRIRIYEEVLITNKPLDLDPDNYRLIQPRLSLFLVSKTIHNEAFQVFYAQTIRLFPTHERFFYTKKPLLARLNERYRNVINTVELVLGPGWTAPPKCQSIQPNLGLDACTNLRTLKIFVTCDPSDIIFCGFRGKNATEDTYKWFCVELLQDFMDEVPSLEMIEIDANTGLRKDAPLIVGLASVVMSARLRLCWGPTLLSSEKEETARGCHEVHLAMTGLSLSDATSVVRVEA